MMRICLIGAIVLSLAVAGVNFFLVKDKITRLGADRDNEKHLKEGKIAELAATNKILVATTADLNKTKKDLGEAITTRDAAVAKADEQSKRADGLAANLKSTEEKLATTSDKLAQWEQLNIPVANARTILNSLGAMSNQVVVMEAEKQVFVTQNKKLKERIAGLLGERPQGPPLPDDLYGKVLQVDPKYNFVVLNIGEKQGALPQGRLLISRNSMLVGEAIISTTEASKCVANISPGWDPTNIREGDIVIAANVEK